MKGGRKDSGGPQIVDHTFKQVTMIFEVGITSNIVSEDAGGILEILVNRGLQELEQILDVGRSLNAGLKERGRLLSLDGLSTKIQWRPGVFGKLEEVSIES